MRPLARATSAPQEPAAAEPPPVAEAAAKPQGGASATPEPSRATASPSVPGELERVAWLLVPVLFAAMLVLHVAGFGASHASQRILVAFELAFFATGTGVVAYLAGRALLARGGPLDAALRDTKERYRALFENMAEGFFLAEVICDPAGKPIDFRYLDANPAFARLTGLARRAVIGRTARELWPDIDATWIEIWGRVALTRRPALLEVFVGPLGRFFASSAYSPGPGQFACVFADTTERRRAEGALREADRRKDEFLGMLSHELRNPLAPIRSSVQVLQSAPPGGEQARRALGVIQRQTEHLTRLVDDLLDVTRIARGKIELRRERVDLRELARRTAEDFRWAMEDRGIAFRTALPLEGVWTDADPTRLAQVVGNLLHNAAKYSRRGDSVTLSLDATGAQAEIRVRDTGAGIDPALLPELFEPFVQGDRTLARTEGGLGLGLALVRSIAALHGGTVLARSAGKGKGAEFVVRLPLVGAAAAQLAAPPGAPLASAGRRVLVVDDNRDAADSLAQIVEMLGHQALVAYDGPSAIERARASRPDVVLCDIGLPGMSGYDVARALRASGPEGVQLVAVSGYAQPDDVKAAVEAGFDRHVAKPASKEDIERALA